jgi:hypothetical protein
MDKTGTDKRILHANSESDQKEMDWQQNKSGRDAGNMHQKL